MLVSNFYIYFVPSFAEPDSLLSNKEPRQTREYYVQVTNLSAHRIHFQVEYRVTDFTFSGRPGTIDANLNTMLVNPQGWTHDANGFYATQDLFAGLNSGGTFGLIPDLWPNESWVKRVLGYAIIRVPVIPSPENSILLIPQSKTPIAVLINAWHEETSVQRVADSDLKMPARYDVPLATGNAYNEIIPDTHPVMRPKPGEVVFMDRDTETHI